MIDFIRQQLENEFLSGGALLMVLAATMAVLRKIPDKIGLFIHRKIITTIDINDQDEAFFWMQEWLAQHPYSLKSRLLSVSTSTSSQYTKPSVDDVEENSLPKIYFTPAPGRHLIRFENRWVLFNRTRDKQEGSNSGRFWREEITLKTLVRDRQFFRRLILATREVADPPGEKRISIYVNSYGSWDLVGKRLPRSFDSVILKDEVVDVVTERSEEFFFSAKWYRERGIPYQMGFLFHGPPGNGKTSTAIALASKFGRNIYLAKVDSITDSSFRTAMANLPQHCILLIEDVDCFFKERDKPKAKANDTPLSFSGFLNALDGVTGTEGRILILTSNYPEELDPALIRPGRVDHKVEFGNATKSQAYRLFMKFFPDMKNVAEIFAEDVGGGEYSMADLQKILLDNRNDPTEAVFKATKREKVA